MVAASVSIDGGSPCQSLQYGMPYVIFMQQKKPGVCMTPGSGVVSECGQVSPAQIAGPGRRSFMETSRWIGITPEVGSIAFDTWPRETHGTDTPSVH